MIFISISFLYLNPMDPKQFKFLLWAPVIMGVALFVGLWTLGRAIENRAATDVITVTGSYKQRVVSDHARWQANFTREAQVGNVKAIIDRVVADGETLKTAVASMGLPAEALMMKPVQTDPIYEQLPNFGQTQKVTGYTVRQEIEIESDDVDKIEQWAKTASALAQKEIVFNYQVTEYTYSKLADLRPELFVKATQDARQRAQAIARGSGLRVGNPRSARTGVIQVLKPNSTEVSDYGAYDLSTKEKEITAVVTVSFGLR